MTDPRLTPSNGRVAHISMQGEVEAEKFVEGRRMMVHQPMANITDKPRGARVSQLLFGETFLVLESYDGFAFGQADRDGQVGYILSGALASPEEPTHWVTAPATHLYPKAELKAPPEVSIFFGSPVRVVGETTSHFRIHTGHYIPRPHLQKIKARFGDVIGFADLFLGSPYLWGGNSRWGIDCSGLVQMACLACGIDCPRDSDQQEALGRELHHGEPLIRGDLVFWKGHVGLMASETMLLHANASHMAVAYEPLEDVVVRIEDAGDGPITAKRRLD